MISCLFLAAEIPIERLLLAVVQVVDRRGQAGDLFLERGAGDDEGRIRERRAELARERCDCGLLSGDRALQLQASVAQAQAQVTALTTQRT